MLGLGSSLAKGGASLLTFVKDNLKLYLDFKSSKSDTLKFPSEGSTEFNGSSNYIETSDSSDFDFGTGDFSISFWFNVDDIDWNWAVSRVNSANSNDVFRAGINNSGKIIFRDIVGSVDVAGSTTISINTWYHFFAVRNNGVLKVYLNGFEDGSASSGGNLDSDKGFIIGRWQGNGDYWNGQLTNVAVWSRALEPEEVQSIMNKSYSQLKGVEKTSLVAWWGLDDDTVNGAINSHVPEILGNEIFPTSNSVYTTDGSHYTKDSATPPNLTYQDTGTGTVTINDSDLEESINISATYKLTFTISGLTSGQANLKAVSTNFGNTYVDETMLDNGTHTFYFIRPAGGGNGFKFRSDTASGSTFTISNYSLKKITSDSYIGHIQGATTTTSVYGGNAPILPRAIDIAESQADAIGDGSASFNGSSDFVQVADSQVLQTDDDMTITAWVNPTGTTTNRVFVSKRDSGGTNYQFYMSNDATPKLRFFAGSDAFSSTDTLTKDEWQHVAISINSGVTNGSVFYINGIASGEFTFTISTNDAPLVIGKHPTSNTYYNGLISQVGLWQGALTAEQVRILAQDVTSYSKIPSSVKSTLGAERVLNSDFSDGENLWNLNNANVVNEVLEIDEGAFSYYAQQSVDGGGSNYRQFESGYLMKIEIVVDEYTSGGTIIYATGNNIGTFNSAGTHTIYYKPSANQYVRLRSNGSGFEGKISSISIKRVTNDIVAYYPLDGDSEVKGLSFDGNDFIQLPVPFSHTNHSISVWVNHSGINEVLFSAQDGSSDGIRLFIDDGNRLQYRINGSGALVTSASYPNQWVHYVCTYDGSTMRVYANGVQVKTNATSQTIDTTTNARIGATSFEAGGYLEGSISSVALYNVTKSADEVLAIYNDSIGGDESSNSGLVGYYKMDNATTVVDNSSNSNNGTVTGATLISAGTTDSVGNNDGGLY